MLNKIVALSVRHRFAVIVIALAIAAFGAVELFRLPIDAVPDITNRQVQINTIAPALAPEQMERQVTYPLETALAPPPAAALSRSLLACPSARRASASSSCFAAVPVTPCSPAELLEAAT